MTFKRLNETSLLAVNDGEGPLISSVQSALDMMADAWYEGGCSGLAVLKQDVDEAFFDLSTRIAGEVLQKYVNYNFKIAIVGDFSGYTSKSLRDFIRESNKGNTVFFVDSVEQAAKRLRN